MFMDNSISSDLSKNNQLGNVLDYLIELELTDQAQSIGWIMQYNLPAPRNKQKKKRLIKQYTYITS